MTSEATQAVIDRHMAALHAGDIDTVMEDYTDDVGLHRQPRGGGRGPGRHPSVPRRRRTAAGLRRDHRLHRRGHLLRHLEADGIAFGTDTLVVRDGKIAVQTVAIVLAP